MADKEPILVRVQLGALRPDGEAAKELIAAYPNGTLLRIEVVKATGNVKRMRFYWQMLRVALASLADAFDGPVRPNAFHVWLKRKLGLSTPIRAKATGEIITWDDDSIAFHNMDEPDRAAFVDRVRDLLAKRLGVAPEILMDEARRDLAA